MMNINNIVDDDVNISDPFMQDDSVQITTVIS